MKSHLIFIGAPGSGKGTQANKFVADRNFKHISTGDLLRSEISKMSPLGLEVKKVMDEGKLVSDDLVIRLLQANINLTASQYIFDGYPRNLAQAQTLDKEVLKGAPSLAVYFEINMTKLVERLTNRRTCKNCGAIYNLISKKPKVMGVCDQCGGTDLQQRADDKEDVIKNRLTVFQDTINPVLKYYQDLGRLMKVDAEGSVDEIYNMISSKV
ncbi:adenylate kinase [Peredibacter sp. HCB2-198]|uniref:adenylate kinase n=1 Tax=Peredibacter sp. HCB2-198 TaxID=3383025 RepID=UPI0038B4AD5C